MPKYPPCSNYNGPQTLYIKNGKKFCRSKKKNRCLSLKPNKVETYSEMLNISKNDLCNKISDIIKKEPNKIFKNNIYSDISIEDIKKVCDILEIKGNFKSQTETFEKIASIILDNASKNMKNLIKDLLPIDKNLNELGYIFSKLIIHNIYPFGKIPFQISEELSKELIKKDILTNETEQQLVKEILNQKLKELSIKKKFLK